MKVRNFVLALVLLFGFIGCEKKVENRKVEGSFYIYYLRSSSWVDYAYDVTINQNGIMQIFEDQGMNNFQRQSNYQISVTELNQIKEKLRNLSLININDKYGFGKNKPTDLPITKIVTIHQYSKIG